MAKVIKQFKKLSTRKLVNEEEPPLRKSASSKNEDATVRKTRRVKKIAVSEEVKETKEKTKPKRTKANVQVSVEQPTSEQRNRRRRRRKTSVSEDESAIAARENEESQEDTPMQQGEFWEYTEHSNLEDGDDFVGGYDFKSLTTDELGAVDFTCLSPEEIIVAQKRQIGQISELLVISASNASNLLRHYGWKTEKLLAKYFDQPTEVMREAGLVGGATSDSEVEVGLTSPGECLVCCEIVEASESCALLCNHRFCHDCWRSYLTMKINEGEVVRINCPAVSCRHVIPDEVVKKLVTEDIFKKYLRFVTRSFVEDNTHFTWCPAPRCGNAITTDMLHNQIVHCTCGFRFCFSCHHEAHTPASCEQIKQWMKKCNDDSETGNWLGSNTKDCPRCQVSVEKNGGCNHMTCRQCTHEWCWLCMRPWKGHSDFYACSRYEKSQKAKERKKTRKTKKQSKIEQLEAEREAKRIALERYLTYYHKYLEHDMTIKQANEIREKAQSKMKVMQSEQSTLAEVKFIESATEMLLECQNVLKYSFVYNYYLEDDAREKHIFAFLLMELQTTTQQLAEILEASGILRRRTEAVDLAKLAQTKKDNLLRGVENGLVESIDS